MDNQTKKRAPRTTRAQYVLYLSVLESNEFFRENKFSSDNPGLMKDMWQDLATKLNASGGTIKTVSEWKRTFSDWRAQVRKRARTLRTAQMETGNTGPPEKPLTDLEQKLLSLIGKGVVDGLPIAELSLPVKDEIKQPSTSGHRPPQSCNSGHRPPESSNSVRHPPQSYTSGRPPLQSSTCRLHPQEKTRKRPYGGLLSMLLEMENDSIHDENLKNINDTLVEILKMKRKKYKYVKKRFQIDYPNITPPSSDTE